MHNPMFVSQFAQGAWHAWMLCRLLMADLRASRQGSRQSDSEFYAEAAAPEGALVFNDRVTDPFDEGVSP